LKLVEIRKQKKNEEGYNISSWEEKKESGVERSKFNVVIKGADEN